MKGTWVIFRRECASLFWTPLGWLLLVAAVLLNGLLYWAQLNQTGGNVTASLSAAMGWGIVFWMVMIFLPPLLAMRLLAEESRTGTLEYLLTAPVSDAAVIVGKFLAATTFMAVLWSSVLLYGLQLQWLGSPPDWAALLCAYLGAILVSGLFVSLSLLASSLTQAPLLAAFLAIIGCTGWLLLPMLMQSALAQLRDILAQWVGGWDRAEAWIQSGIRSIDVAMHFQQSFLPGVLDSAELVFFLTWSGLFLFLTIRSLEARRWRV
ncbi:MAG: ABC transporter permease [Planctomycetes bacterium]|nr:ABC transporter permease [Planctomycetota bacterium]MCB9909181.1 ABC transporter permease [Planctomycetota bacterium]HPF14213.1 ABC transporter permease [Planctomycetota bacterium]HRV80178.1 ABC transporter permease [Planctomycetota bacterium]